MTETVVSNPLMSGFSFDQALVALKMGDRITREGWNCLGQWVKMQAPDYYSKMTRPYLYLKNAQDDLVPWVPSQGDLFAEDWEMYT